MPPEGLRLPVQPENSLKLKGVHNGRIFKINIIYTDIDNMRVFIAVVIDGQSKINSHS